MNINWKNYHDLIDVLQGLTLTTGQEKTLSQNQIEVINDLLEDMLDSAKAFRLRTTSAKNKSL